MERSQQKEEQQACSLEEIFGEPIAIYTREQAIEDGVLFDVSEWASGTTGFIGGFSVPVAVTAGVWKTLQDIPERFKGVQSLRGRAHDLLWMASLAARRGQQPSVMFSVLMHTTTTISRKQTFRIEIGPDDNGSPCVTILLPDED